MFAIVYEWVVPPEREQDFVDGWTSATRLIREQCGSFGSRLHRADHGRWIGYARWPSLAARDACHPPPVPGWQEWVEQGREIYRMQIVQDLLEEPAPE